MKNISMKHLAKALNLSTATISKALSDSYDISDETKQRVLKLARELRYIPHAQASSLRGKKSKTIAMVIPEVADSYFAQAINGVEKIAYADGFHVLIYLTHEQLEREKAILKELLNGRIDGLLISVTRQSEEAYHINELVAAGLPVVFFDRIFENIGRGEVTTNDYRASYLLTEHLIQQGCRNIDFLLFSNALSIIKTRLEGYKQALLDYGLIFNTENLIVCSNHDQENERLIQYRLGHKNRPDAIIASVEKLVICTYHACALKHLSIPETIKIAAFANLPTASILQPPMTTITQPAFEMGQAAASLLIKTIKGKSVDPAETKVIIPSKLDLRKSTMLYTT
ncbi:LacI family DNA-binding transcriptional regulator [Olivibacter ginsenosidimutans]|uniref:LacI family DNA-binding transcriptional regulator n=1 Tax=Olivibacter ginsenosidimutans TaxID=1176537 RepID=A0ABP9BST1_9SPHI